MRVLRKLAKNLPFRIFFVIFIPVLFITVGFAALSTSLSVNGGAMVDPVGMIVVMSVGPEQSTSIYSISSSHTSDSINLVADLPTLSDQIIYNVAIKNLGQTYKSLSQVVADEFTNNDMNYVVSGLSVGDVIEPGQTVNCSVTLRYNNGITNITNSRINTVIRFIFDNYELPYITAYFAPYDGSSSIMGFPKNIITGFKRNTTLTKAQVTSIPDVKTVHNVSQDQYNSSTEIYAWIDSTGVLNWWSSANMVYFHPDTLYAFKNIPNIISIDLTDISTEKVENFAHWFDTNRKLKRIIGKINTSGLKLHYNDSFNYLEDQNNDSSSGYGLTYMFNDCNELIEVDLSEIVTHNASDMKRMFAGCKKLPEIDVSRFDTSNVKSIYWMFRNCFQVTDLDLTTFDTSNVVNMYGVFTSASNLKTIIFGDKFDTSNVKYFRNMFYGTGNLTTIYVKKDFVISSNSISNDMFRGTNKLVGAAGTPYQKKFDPKFIDATYAKIALSNQEGYFTLGEDNIDYNIKYTYNGGSASNPSTYNVNSSTFTLNIPIKEGYTFKGWTGSNGNTPERTVTILQGTIGNKHYEASYEPNSYMVQFNGNGGEGTMSFMDFVYNESQALRKNTFTYEDHKFAGWNTKEDGSGISYSDGQNVMNVTSSGTITLYAQWIDSSVNLIKVFSADGPCTFNGNSANISGETCSLYSNSKFINTGVSLFDDNNRDKDFEIGLTIDEYLPSNQNENQATFLNSKLENTSLGYPGFVLRRTGNNIELTCRFDSIRKSAVFSYSSVKSIRIVRKNNVIYYSLNGGKWIVFQDISSYTGTFDTPVTFGSSLNPDGTPMRIVKNTNISNMYIKVGTIDSLD